MVFGETYLTWFLEPTRDSGCVPMPAVKRSTRVVTATPLEGRHFRHGIIAQLVGPLWMPGQ